MYDNLDFNILRYLLDTPYEILDDQIDDIKSMVMSKKLMMTHETGLGKTLLAVGAIATLLPKMRKERKVMIVTAPTNKVAGFANDIQTFIPGVRVITSTGQKPDVDRVIREFENIDVIVCMGSLWASIDFNYFIFENIDRFIGCIYDEASGVANDAFLVFAEYANKFFEYTYVMNATPIKTASKLKMTYNLLYTVGAFNHNYTLRDFEKDVVIRTGGSRGKGGEVMLNVNRFKELFGKYMLNLSKTDVGVNITGDVQMHKCQLSKVQEDVLFTKFHTKPNLLTSSQERSMDEILYNPKSLYQISPMTMPALAKTLELVTARLQDNDVSNVVVYLENVDIKNRFKDMCIILGYDTYMIDGSMNYKEKDAEEERFKSANKSVMLTNIESASSFPSANAIIIYGFADNIIQTINRLPRGRQDKHIYVDWVYYGVGGLSKLKTQLEMSVENDRLTGRTTMTTKPLFNEIKHHYNEPSIERYRAFIK